MPHVFIIKMNSHEQRERLKTVFKKHSVEFGCHYKPNHLLTKFNDPELDYSELSNTMDHYLRAITIPCLLYTSPSPRDAHESRMPSSA